MRDDNKSLEEKYDTNQDGVLSEDEIQKQEMLIKLEYDRIRLENEDKKADSQRKMAWYGLFGMLLYPFAVLLAVFVGLESAATILGDMAPAYFVAVAGIVAAFFVSQNMNTK